MMTSKDLTGSRKKGDEPSAPPGFVSLTSFTLKRKRDRQPEQNEAYSKTTDIEKLQKSFKKRPWILNDQLTNLEKPDMQHLNPVIYLIFLFFSKCLLYAVFIVSFEVIVNNRFFLQNISVENSLPKGVIRGCPSCSNCQKVIACWRSEEGCRPPSVVYRGVFNPTEEEFKDIYKYIEKIRLKAEENGICRINPPESWEPPFLMKENKFDTTKFGTHVQEINALKDLHSKRKLNEIIEQKDGSDGFEFESGPEMVFGCGTSSLGLVEGDILAVIIQNPTEEIQVLSGHNLEAKVLGSGFPLPTPDDHNDNQSKYRKSGWNLNNTPKMPGSLLAFVTQLSPSILKSEGIPVYRCVQNPKQFILIFPGAYYAGFDTGFSVSEKANFAPLIERQAKSWDFKTARVGILSRVRRESFKRESLCNGSQSREMEEDFGCSVKRECFLCFSDLYLSAAGCSCSPDKYSCLEHSKQICTCPWSSRFFLFRSSIGELNLLIDTLNGKVNP
ncbi:putative lysine-specific demethylase JMJ16 isoform X2 [Tanacetum coccineum]